MAQKPMTEQQLRETLEAVKMYGGVKAASVALGIPPGTFEHRVRKARKFEQQIVIDPPPEAESVDDILAYKRKIFAHRKAHKDYTKLINVAVKHSGAIGVTLIGDPHIDDDGCDIEALERDLQVIRDTKAMYAGHVGDLTNNWVGRLARLYAHQVTTAGQAIKLMEWMLEYCPNLFVVLGNHDLWNQGADIISLIMRQQRTTVEPHGARIALNFESGKQIRINARHDFKGNSQYNPTHGHRKEQLWGGMRDHIYVSGHRHSDGASVLPHPDGTCSWSYMVSGYKLIDDYSDAHGFHEQRIAPSVTAIINPNARVEAELIKPFWDTEAAADYLNYVRKKK